MKKLICILLVAILIPGCSRVSSDKIITLASSSEVRDVFIAQVMSYILEENGYKVERKYYLKSEDLQKKLEDGSIDLYSGYLDNVYKNILNGNDNVFGTKKYQLVCRGMKQHNTVVLGKTLASSSLGFAIDRKIAEYYKIKKISDLKKNAPFLKFAYDESYKGTSYGEERFNEKYGQMKWKSITSQKYDQKELNILSGYADVITCDATDPMMEKGNVGILKDDKKAFRDFNNIIFMANSDYVTKHSNLEHIFDRFGNKLSTRLLREYLAKIDTEETEVKNIATRFYINEIH